MTNLIDQYIKDLNEKTRQDRAGALHPSNLGKCPRKAIYEYLGEEPTVEHSIETLRAFRMGFLIEELVTKAHDAKGVLIADQMPLGAEIEGVPVRGTLDELLEWEDGYVISDAKSVHANAFRYGKFPYHHHELQLGAYEWMLEEMVQRYGKALAIFKETVKLDPALEDLMHDLTRGKPTSWRTWLRNLLADIGDGAHGPRKPSVIYYLSYVSTYELKLKRVRVSKTAKREAVQELIDLAIYARKGVIPERPFKTPREHNWLCMKKAPGGRVPGCTYFGTCWPEE